MKTGKFKGVTLIEACGVASHFGSTKLLVRHAPLLDKSQIVEVLAEFKNEKCDGVLFDKEAIFDAVAYELAHDCAEQIVKKFGDKVKVLIYNAPDND